MIFLIMLVVLMGVVLATMQFGAAPTTATPRAEVYAVNMTTWHQAAMQALTFQGTSNSETQDEQAGTNACSSTTSPCVVALNSYIWNGTTTAGALANNWKEYQPMVVEGDPTKPLSGGWQSFLFRNISGTNPACTNCTESYVLTVFRGYGAASGSSATSGNRVSNNLGNMDAVEFASALSRTVKDRIGVGVLNCSTATEICQFTRNAAYVNNSGATQTDLPLGFSVTPFSALSGALPTGQDVATVLNGLPAIMTRVGGGGVQCSAMSIIFPTGTGSTYTLDPSTSAGGINPCYGTFPATPYNTSNPSIPLGGLGSNPAGYIASGTATCGSNGQWTVNSLSCSTQSCPSAYLAWSILGSTPSITTTLQTTADCAGGPIGTNGSVNNSINGNNGSASAQCVAGQWQPGTSFCSPNQPACTSDPVSCCQAQCSGPDDHDCICGCENSAWAPASGRCCSNTVGNDGTCDN